MFMNVGLDDTDSDCLALKWTFEQASALECGTAGSPFGDWPLAGGSDYTPTYGGPPTYNTFEAAFDDTKKCISKLKVWGKEPVTDAFGDLWRYYDTENRPSDAAAP
jgi:hypothetical protein